MIADIAGKANDDPDRGRALVDALGELGISMSEVVMASVEHDARKEALKEARKELKKWQAAEHEAAALVEQIRNGHWQREMFMADAE